MPRFERPGAREEYQEKMQLLAEWRLGVLADLVWEAMPFNEWATWEEVAHNAVDEFENGGGWQEDPMFTDMGYSDRFVNEAGIQRRSSDIVDKLAEENRFVYTKPFRGVRKANSRDEIRETLDAHRDVVRGRVRRYNLRAEYANQRRGTQIELLNINLLPARTGN